MEAPTNRVTWQQLDEMERHARLWGSANCWTGTGGSLAAVVLRLVREVRAVTAERDEAKLTLASLTTDDGGS